MQLSISLVISLAQVIGTASGNTSADSPRLPNRGICAHRGASDTHPENTLPALREAARLGAHMIEFDVALTRDDELVLMHDATVDRTTNGKGAVANLTLPELRKLDAGSWKDPAFREERIPTLDEALEILPENVWLNVHVKGDAALAEKAARRIVAHNRLHQAFLACGTAAAGAAKQVDPGIKICNMERQPSSRQYARETIDQQADIIQFLAGQSFDHDVIQVLQKHRVRINYCCANDVRSLQTLFAAGVEFVLVDKVAEMLNAADELGVRRVRPEYRASITVKTE